MNFSFVEYTSQGPRSENEDSFSVKNCGANLYSCIADGVGGSKCGRLASKHSVESFMSKIETSGGRLKEILLEINEEIKSLQEKFPECKGMATTFTGCQIKNYKLLGVHLGDSRLCVLRGNGIKQLTDTHTEASRLLKAGKLSTTDFLEYPRKHIIESALGMAGELTIQVFDFELLQGDRIILTTDGFHDLIKKYEFRDLSIKSKDLATFGRLLVDLLLSRKLSDNATFVAIEVA